MYGYTKKTNLSFQQAVEKIKETLKEQGFGILTEIDVKATLKKKLGVDFENYLILGACNPPLAYKALQTEHEIGLLLPCNVIVYEKEGEVFVSALLPSKALSIVENPELSEVAEKAEEKLKKAVDNV